MVQLLSFFNRTSLNLTLIFWFPRSRILSGFVSYLHLPRFLWALQVFLMILSKTKAIIYLLPLWIKLLCIIFINIEIMISLLNVWSFLFTHNLSTFIIKHSLFSYAINSLIIFIRLLFLRNCFPSFILTHAIFIIVLSHHFTIGTHFRWTDKTLANIRSLVSFAMNVFMH